jgi:putative transposase
MPNIKSRRPRRLRGFDYREARVYFVTLCTHNRKHTLGRVEQDQVILSALGALIECVIDGLESHQRCVKLHNYVIMPNHLHLMVELQTETGEQASRDLGVVVSRFKFACTREWRNVHPQAAEIWQKRFHDVIVRSERQYLALYQYIEDNPIRWHLDELNMEEYESSPIRPFR